MTDQFFGEGYKLPESSSFMKFQAGKNKFRILSAPVTGYEYWTNDNKPVRSKEMFTDTPGIRLEKNGKGNIAHFWGMVVYNYDTDSIQLLEITQKGVQKYILGLAQDPAWGSPRKYDLVITKTGSGLETKYSTVANPHSEMNAEIMKRYEDAGIDPESLFENA